MLTSLPDDKNPSEKDYQTQFKLTHNLESDLAQF